MKRVIILEFDYFYAINNPCVHKLYNNARRMQKVKGI
jgi:hypothetical protein